MARGIVPGFDALCDAVYAALEKVDHVDGQGCTRIRDLLPMRSRVSAFHVSRALARLADRGRIESWDYGDRKRYRIAGRHTVAPERWKARGGINAKPQARTDTHVVYETPAMAKQLENLFSICPYDYSHGNIISLERGRVGLKPSFPVPGRAIGGW